jgi:hypothetical protein
MRLDRHVAFAVCIGTALYFLLPEMAWFARLCENWIAVELLLRMLKKK